MRDRSGLEWISKVASKALQYTAAGGEMRVSVSTFAGALGAFNVLIHWGPLEYRDDLLSTRRETFDDLREGLHELHNDVADDASFAAVLLARSLVDRAMIQYTIGRDIEGGKALLLRSLEAFQSVRLKAGRTGGDASHNAEVRDAS